MDFSKALSKSQAQIDIWKIPILGNEYISLCSDANQMIQSPSI